MIVELRIYKRFDQELIALYSQGADLGEILRRVLYAFARGEQLHYAVCADSLCGIEERRTFHLRVQVTDPESQRVLKSVKSSYRNSFCKALIREAFVFQALGVYLSDSYYVSQRNDNFSHKPIGFEIYNFERKRHRHTENGSATPSPVIGIPETEQSTGTSVPEALAAQSPVSTVKELKTPQNFNVDEAFARLIF